MRQNKYDNEAFFNKYAQMLRSREGLAGAGEWLTLKKMLPDFAGKTVLDLGCGYGWHCVYAAEQGAAEVVGVDISERMLAVAGAKTKQQNVRYIRTAMEEAEFPSGSFDIVLSSLAVHYIEDLHALFRRVNGFLKEGGAFVFSAEHPVYTACANADFIRSASTIIFTRESATACFWASLSSNTTARSPRISARSPKAVSPFAILPSRCRPNRCADSKKCGMKCAAR